MLSEAAGLFEANGTYGLGVLTADFDNDGWPDIYVANDSTASALYQNKHNRKNLSIVCDGIRPARSAHWWQATSPAWEFPPEITISTAISTS